MTTNTQKPIAYITNNHGRHEVIVHEIHIDKSGVMIARVQYAADRLGHIFEIVAKRVSVENAPAHESEAA